MKSRLSGRGEKSFCASMDEGTMGREGVEGGVGSKGDCGSEEEVGGV